MTKEDARSLAWSVVEGMPLVVHNAAWPKKEGEVATQKAPLPKARGERALEKPAPAKPSSSPPDKIEELTHGVEPPTPPTPAPPSEETSESTPEPNQPNPESPSPY
jgi:hypothetical protein